MEFVNSGIPKAMPKDAKINIIIITIIPKIRVSFASLNIAELRFVMLNLNEKFS
jgi:hypothetical protein